VQELPTQEEEEEQQQPRPAQLEHDYDVIFDELYMHSEGVHQTDALLLLRQRKHFTRWSHESGWKMIIITLIFHWAGGKRKNLSMMWLLVLKIGFVNWVIDVVSTLQKIFLEGRH
jgi:hypothetical protein